MNVFSFNKDEIQAVKYKFYSNITTILVVQLQLLKLDLQFQLIIHKQRTQTFYKPFLNLSNKFASPQSIVPGNFLFIASLHLKFYKSVLNISHSNEL